MAQNATPVSVVELARPAGTQIITSSKELSHVSCWRTFYVDIFSLSTNSVALNDVDRLIFVQQPKERHKLMSQFLSDINTRAIVIFKQKEQSSKDEGQKRRSKDSLMTR
eukprot:gene15321-16898_t